MKDKFGKTNIGRRKFLTVTAGTVAGSSLVGVTRASKGKIVPKGLAKKAANQQRKIASNEGQFSNWENASLGKPETFFMIADTKNRRKYQKSAYVFPVTKGNSEIGYITAAAQRSMDPILEYSTAKSPVSRIAESHSTIQKKGHKLSGRPIYHGGVQYGHEIANGNIANIRNNHQYRAKSSSPSSLKFNEQKSRNLWKNIELSTAPSGSPNSNEPPIPSGNNAGHVYGVPCWTEHDLGSFTIDQTYYGPETDKWDDWDGCVPVAASMIIGYHQSVSEYDDFDREWIIDNLHDSMNTNDYGATNPDDIDNGIDNYPDGSFDGYTYYVTDQDLVRKEIDNNRPFLLNMTSGDHPEDEPSDYGPYGEHTVAVVGYDYDGGQLEIHDTWNDERHRLNWGNWLACSITTVTQT